MKGLATLRTAVLLVCVSLSVTACGGGSASAPAVPSGSGAFGASSVASVARIPASAGIRSVGTRNATCAQFPHPAPLLPPACTIYVGGFISPTQAETPSQQVASENTFEAQIGRPLALALHYYQWTDQWPGSSKPTTPANGRIPVESWHCGAKDSDIINGVWDGLLAKRAAAVAAYGRPIFMRYKWEMNLTYNPTRAEIRSVTSHSEDSHRVHYDPTNFI